VNRAFTFPAKAGQQNVKIKIVKHKMSEEIRKNCTQQLSTSTTAIIHHRQKLKNICYYAKNYKQSQ